MRAGIFVVCFVAGYLVADSFALRCNFCFGSLDSDCAHGVNSSMAVIRCTPPGDHGHSRFIPQSYKHHRRLHPTSLDDDNDFGNNKLEDIDETVTRSLSKLDMHCIVLSTKGDPIVGDLFERSCGYIYEGVDICKYIEKHNSHVTKCKSCNGDQCN